MNTLRFSTLARSLRVLSQPFKGYPARSFFQRPASKVPSKNVFTRHRNYNVNPAPILLVSGVMSFLGLNNQEEEKEDELIMTLKRSVLLMQVCWVLVQFIGHKILHFSCIFYATNYF